MNLEIVGFIAGTLTTISFVPQVVKALRTRSVDDLSIGMLLTFTLGVVMWLAYGVVLRDAPLLIFNSITLVLTSVLVWLKIGAWRRGRRAPATERDDGRR
ncbi:MAG: SemiSWEET family sugar transporter [Rhodospirillales bacterium]|nr:MAG: SemiSWEET family sugar transporter [Rhodospirillales bacterium]